MDLVKVAKTFESKIKKIKPEEVESFEGFTSLFYECFKPCIEGNEGRIDFIKSFYEELKSFDGKPINEQTSETYCELFAEKALKQRILETNSEFIDRFRNGVKPSIVRRLRYKIGVMNLNQNNEGNIQMIIDLLGDLARRFNKQNRGTGTIYYREILNAFSERLRSCKTKIDQVVKSSIGRCFYVFNDEDEDEKLEYKETVKKLKELEEKIIKCEYLLDDGGKKIVESANYKNFKKVIIEIAKDQSE